MRYLEPPRIHVVSAQILVALLVFDVSKHGINGKITLKPGLIEGDIVLDETTALAVVDYGHGASRRKREVVRNNVRLWEDGIIPYVISEDTSTTGRKFIRKAFHQFARKTCITFIPKQDHHKDYVNFIVGDGCYSSVGRKGGEQVVSLGIHCINRGNAIHEIMHTLGFFHEHSRFDRDKYIKILWWNIRQGMQRNFISYSHETTDSLNEPYDYSSIMHYNNKAFSRNGRDTIQSKFHPFLRFGDGRRLSPVDTKQLAKLYNCSNRRKLKRVPCRNKYRMCWKYAAKSDLCETSYNFMRIYCRKACAFCYS